MFEANGTNITVPNCDLSDKKDGIHNLNFKVVVYLMYTTVFLMGFIGNFIVCSMIQWLPKMRTVTNLFIANLAFGDMLITLFCVPFTFVSLFVLHYWPFGKLICRLVNYSQAVSVLVSAYTLVAISADRYMAIMRPMKPKMSGKCAKILIVLIWIGALITALPIAVYSDLMEPPSKWYKKCEKLICTEIWPAEKDNFIYTMALMTLQFIIPLLVLIYTYTRIAVYVWGKSPPGESVRSRDKRIAKSKRKMIKMMVLVVICFTFCWLPFNIFMLIPLDPNWQFLPYFWFAFHWLAMSHSCYNPVIYCYMHEKFRNGFQQLFYRLLCKRTQGVGSSTIGLYPMTTCSTYVRK